MADDGTQTGEVVARILGVSLEELKRLAGDSVVFKTGPNRYNLLQSVRGYINHLQTKTTRAPTQIEIAEHLDMSERNARDVLKPLGIDWTTSTLDIIRTAYLRDLREKAAGRGGDDQFNLTKNRAREAEMSANLKELQIAEKTRTLVPADEVEDAMVAMITAARSELLTLTDKIVMSIKTLAGVDVDPSLIEEFIHEALQHLANGLPNDAASGDGTSSPGVGAAA